MKRQAWWMAVLFTAILMVPCAGRAQQTDEKKAEPAPEFQFYKLSFSLRELEDGKVLNTRSYVTNMRSMTRGAIRSGASVRAGTRVPVTTTFGGNGGGNTEIKYNDVGVNIDCEMEAPNPGAAASAGGTASAIRVSLDISSLAPSEPSQAGPGNPLTPLIRSVRGSSTIPFVLDKPILVTSVDDVTSKRQYQLEVTITKK